MKSEIHHLSWLIKRERENAKETTVNEVRNTPSILANRERRGEGGREGERDRQREQKKQQ